jgi:outer membrane biosynthesis protein TonB
MQSTRSSNLAKFDMMAPQECESKSSMFNDSLSLEKEMECGDEDEEMKCEDKCEKKEEEKMVKMEEKKEKNEKKKMMAPKKKKKNKKEEKVQVNEMKKEEKVQEKEKEKEKKVLPVIKFDLNQLIFSQNTSGSWDLKKLFQIISKDENKSKDHLNSKINEDQKKLPNLIEGWATALAIAILSKFFKEKKDEWDMIEQKGIKFLKKNRFINLFIIIDNFLLIFFIFNFFFYF